MRLPTFSRQSDTTAETEARPAGATSATTPVRPRTDASVTPPPAAPPVVERRRPADEDTLVNQQAVGNEPKTRDDLKSRDLQAPRPVAARTDRGDRFDGADRFDRGDEKTIEQPPVVAGPKPRASLLATMGLIVSVVAALLVLSGPLLGYGIGLAVLGLILSLSGIHATGKRHIAGKTDALIGMILSLGAIVVGVLALTGSLSWLGTDMQPVTSVREWLDAQFIDRF
ncbi:thrombospondin [Actinoplanes sp. CA-051413]|uniref:thrombospondin n=1 Tax=Actinoplanes sp. CA-051413 TaxID=3239899 RepID=UPI003D973419